MTIPDHSSCASAAVIGAGLIGARRARDFLTISGTRVIWVCDPEPSRGQTLADELSVRQGAACMWVPDLAEVLSAPLPDLALIAVPHDLGAKIASQFLERGVHVHLEKPMGRTFAEALNLAAVAEQSHARLAVGFNYRHYPAVMRAKELIDAGRIGKPLMLRMLLGHGGRPGYESEWKVQRASAGGGALFDPGIHLVDLAGFFLGDLAAKSVHLHRLFWPTDVEDSAIAILDSEVGAAVLIQASLIEWRNTFAIALQGADGYLRIQGRMGNYGPQTLSYGRRWAWLDGGTQAESEQVEDFGSDDPSFADQLSEVVAAIREGRSLPAGLSDGLTAMRLIRDLYDLGQGAEAGVNQPLHRSAL